MEPVASSMTQVSDDLPQLKKIEQDLMEAVPKNFHAAVDRMVVAGMKIMFSKETHGEMAKQFESLGQSSDAVAMAIAAVMSHIQRASKGPMPIPAVVPAAIILMCQLLDFLAKGGKISLSDELIADATSKLLAYLSQKLGITPEVVAQAKQQSAQGAPQQQPQQPANLGNQPEPLPPEAGGQPGAIT